MVTASEAVFKETSPGVFTRKCTSNEAGCSLLSEQDGNTHATFSANVRLLKDVSQVVLKEKVIRAMIRLRHLVPGIGCSTSMLAPAQEFQLRYEVPKSLDAVREWAAAAIHFHKEQLTFEEAHDAMVDSVWWKASDNNCSHELHIHPSPAGKDTWTFTLSAHHSNADGRSAWMYLEKVFTFVQGDLLGQSTPLEDLNWGEETCRLSAVPESVCSIAKNGKNNPDEFPDVSGFTRPSPPEGYVPFLHPCRADEKVKDGVSAARFYFTKEQTSKLHSLCKEHGRTVTQAATALVNLAHAEWALRVSSNKDDLYEGTLEIFDKATHFPAGTNAINARVLLPEEYRTFDTEHSTPLNCVEVVPLTFPMQPYRKMLSVDRNSRTVTPARSDDVFWAELVKDVAEAWAKVDRSLDAYRFRCALFTAMTTTPGLDVSKIRDGSLGYTSCGDMTRLNILESFRPSAGNEAIVIDCLTYTNRYFIPGIASCFLEYDGVFSIMCFGNKKFWPKEEMELRNAITKKWAETLF